MEKKIIQTVIKEYSLGMNYTQLGKKYKRSSERIRQLVNRVLKFYCSVHKRRFLVECDLCKIEKEYPAKLKKNLEKEIRLLLDSRDAVTVLKRKMIAVWLRDKFKMKPTQIAVKLNRDYASIIYLLDKDNDRKK